MSPSTRSPAPPPDEGAPERRSPPSEPRQRWRLTYERAAPAGSGDVGREYAERWEAAWLASGLPVALVESGRPRVSIGAPLPLGIAGRAELMDVLLTETLPAWRVREAIGPVLPDRHRLVSLENVWLGAPPLPGRVAGADYLISVVGVEPSRLERAVADLNRAEHLPRERPKGGGVKAYDLRPLIAAAEVVSTRPPLTLRLRTVIHPELGSGRPDEVLAALADLAGEPLQATEIVRERLVLAGEAG